MSSGKCFVVVDSQTNRFDVPETAEPAVSRVNVDFDFEDALGIVAVGLVVLLLAIGVYTAFGNEIPESSMHFSNGLAYVFLLVPPAIYIFSFWAYRQILFNEQLKQAFNLYSTKPDFRKNIIDKVKEKLSELDKKHFEKKPDPSKYDFVSQQIRKQLDEEASRALVSVYGISLSAYFPILIILELVVILGFVLPIYELMSTGYIGVLSLTIFSGLTALPSWIVEWAFFGAFVHSFFNMMDRVPRKDIRPNFYLNTLIRYILAIAIAAVFYLTLGEVLPVGVLAGLSFIIGMFPNVFLRHIEDRIAGFARISLSSDIPLTKLPDVGRMEASRLWEEGIHNIDQLADCDVAELHKKTHYDHNRLSTIIGKAILWRALGGGEKPSSENQAKPDDTRVKNETSKEAKASLDSSNKINEKERKTKNKLNRFVILKSLGISTIQDLYSFLFDTNFDNPQVEAEKISLHAEGVSEKLKMLEAKIGLNQIFIFNAAKTALNYKEQLKIPPSAVEWVVLTKR